MTHHFTITFTEYNNHYYHPLPLAAYQSRQSTTEQGFAIKSLAEKAINSDNNYIFIMLLDMPKSFETVNRKKLMEILEKILRKCEIHMTHIFIHAIFKVKIGKKNKSENPHKSWNLLRGMPIYPLSAYLML